MDAALYLKGVLVYFIFVMPLVPLTTYVPNLPYIHSVNVKGSAVYANANIGVCRC